MRTTTEMYLETRSYRLLLASSRALNLWLRLTFDYERADKAHRLYEILTAKYDATAYALDLLSKDRQIAKWKRLDEKLYDAGIELQETAAAL